MKIIKIIRQKSKLENTSFPMKDLGCETIREVKDLVWNGVVVSNQS